MTKLWQKKAKLDNEIEKFTVGSDFLIDNYLVPYDVDASKAHAHMLSRIGILTAKESKQLCKELDRFEQLHRTGKIILTQQDEDCHTAIENYLTKKLGNVGKKIHTGRSRNDQSLTAIRLFVRKELNEILDETKRLKVSLKKQIRKNGKIRIPGYTHMRKAMPSSVKMMI
ncbi:MAG: lyase family protein [Nanoarchaeota archaeon]